MNQLQSRDRRALVEQVLSATTLDEIDTAREALRSWISTHPHDRESLRDGFEQLANMEEAANLLVREPASV